MLHEGGTATEMDGGFMSEAVTGATVHLVMDAKEIPLEDGN